MRLRYQKPRRSGLQRSSATETSDPASLPCCKAYRHRYLVRQKRDQRKTAQRPNICSMASLRSRLGTETSFKSHAALFMGYGVIKCRSLGRRIRCQGRWRDRAAYVAHIYTQNLYTSARDVTASASIAQTVYRFLTEGLESSNQCKRVDRNHLVRYTLFSVDCLCLHLTHLRLPSLSPSRRSLPRKAQFSLQSCSKISPAAAASTAILRTRAPDLMPFSFRHSPSSLFDRCCPRHIY